MIERNRQLKVLRKQERETNAPFHASEQRIHRLMNLFLALIAIEWAIVFLTDGFDWTGVWEIALALAVHVFAENLLLNGFTAIGSAVILADAAVDLGGYWTAFVDEGIHTPLWHILLGAGFALILAGIGLYCAFSADILNYAKRARALRLDVFNSQ